MQFNSFSEFYPYYLAEHSHPTCRLLHFIGTWLVIVVVIASIVTATPWLLLLIPIVGYGFAWVGHYVYEKNKPATFQHPLYSLIGDWVMFWEILQGKISLTSNK